MGSREELLLNLWNTQPSSVSRDVLNPATYKRPVTLLSHTPRLFALLIGIDHYRTVQHLQGAVADTLAFKDYLETHLSVPSVQITTLLNGAATRSQIIRQLTRLKESKNIVKGDAILIYFAGYGGEVTYSDEPKHTNQFIVPQDYSSDRKGRVVEAIPIQTVTSLVTKIADIKGDNITLVFDCSYTYPTAAAEPAKERSAFRIRVIPLPRDIHPPTLDQNIWAAKKFFEFKKTNVNPFNGDVHPYMMVQACSPSECAHEITRGEFSRSFLNLLRNVSPHALRYIDIGHQIDQIPSQTPQIHGPYPHRSLFNGLVLVSHQTAYRISKTKTQLILHAGTVNGLAEGAEFTAHDATDTLLEKPLGTLCIKSLCTFSSEVGFIGGSASLDENAFAVQTKSGSRGDVRFYFPMDDRLLPCYEAYLSILRSGGTDVNYITLVDNPRDAHIEIAVEDDRAVFIVRDEQVRQHGLTRLPHDCALSPGELFDVMKAAAHYYWKFNRANDNPDINNNIKVAFHQLEDLTNETDSLGGYKFEPCGPNLCRNGIVEMVVEENIPYGLELTNNSSYDLYPYMFYFDSSDFSIGTYYNPAIECPMSGPPLKKNGGTLTIGYGNGGGNPFSYYVPEGQVYDLGFMKLFFTTEPVDLSGIPQPTPFETARSRSGETKRPKEKTWGTCIIPILQYNSAEATGGRVHCPRCGCVSPRMPYDHPPETLTVQNGVTEYDDDNANDEHQSSSPPPPYNDEHASSSKLCADCEQYSKDVADVEHGLELQSQQDRKSWFTIFIEKLLGFLHFRGVKL